MNRGCLLALTLAAAWTARAQPYAQRWNYAAADLGSDAGADAFIAVLRQSKDVGCTHILMPEGRCLRLGEQPPEYTQRVERVKAVAKDLGLSLVPSVFSVGYSGRYFHFDPNLAAGLPVRRMPFVVKGGKAEPDPALVVDTSAHRTAESPFAERFPVRPFQHYRISFSVAGTAPPVDLEECLKVVSSNRWLSRAHPVFRTDAGRTLVQTTFNSLDATEVSAVINMGTRKLENLRIEPAGLLLVLRRSMIPLTVTSADGQTVYQEGADFKRVADPALLVSPFPGEYPIDHPAVPLELTPGSKLRDGQSLLVSFWHAQRVGADQDVASIQDPALFGIMELELTNSINVWGAGGYFMIYDAQDTEAMKKNVRNWVAVSRGVPNVLGLMYTTWRRDHTRLAEYFRLLDTYAEWAQPKPAN